MAVSNKGVGIVAAVLALSMTAEGVEVGFVRKVMDFVADCGESHATKSRSPEAKPVICFSNFMMKCISIVFQFRSAFIFYVKVKPEYLIKCQGIVKFCKSSAMD